MEGRLSKDSYNSHKPPSSDKPPQRRSSLRKSSGKKGGGQVGHKGSTLEPVEKPDKTVIHQVEHCQHCASSLSNIKALDYDKRQVFDIPPKLIEVTEHQAELKECPCCHKQSRADFPSHVTHRTQYGARFKSIAAYLLNQQLLPYERTAELFDNIFSQKLSIGTLVNINQACSEGLASHD